MSKTQDVAESSKTALAKQQKTTYKSIFQKDEKTLREEALSLIPEEMQLKAEAYSMAVKSASTKEYVYPYIPTMTIWICPIEKKYSHLSAEEVMTFYMKNFSDPFLYPKDYLFYQDVLKYTGSVQFDSTARSGEWAFSKATIIKILSPENWDGDLFKSKDLPTGSKNPYRSKILFNYFDYIKAWDIAFCYENKQKKHSWFIQFKDQGFMNYPNWFLVWFSNYGLYPLIFPNKIRAIYDNFVKINPSLKNHGLVFSITYQVPWILRWDVITSIRSVSRFDFCYEIPYLGRRILIKWWDKFNFFEDSIYAERGLISFEPVKALPLPPKRDVSELLKELMSSSSSKKELKNQLKLLLDSDSDNELMSISTDKSSDEKN